ncbi:DUF3817 domain-containing protein [Brevibacterium litoralis]|uniref:DUF3817 domain-containing protein n=1 Tax=Brevibacterium litoralis TaxID=3138935 RepID=UPI0032EE8834
MTPKRFFAVFAIGEAVTWALLIAGMVLKYGTRTTDALVSIGGALHGFMFLAFVVATLVVGLSQGWKWWVTLLGVLSAIPPFFTIPFDWWVTKSGRLDGGWQLAPGGPDSREPRTALERAVRWCFGHALLAGLVLAGLVVVVFVALMISGPPV